MKFVRNILKSRLIRDLDIVPPIPSANRGGIAIVTRTLNDEDFFEEWVEFHRLAGISHFFVYLDGDFSTALAKYSAHAPEGLCTFIPWCHVVHDAKSGRRIHPQTSAFAHAIQNFGQNYLLMAFIDVDEFLVPKGHATILDALERTNGYPNISLPWHMFGFSDQGSASIHGVVETYTTRAREVLAKENNYLNFKCLLDPCTIVTVGVHNFKTRQFGEKTSNTDGFVTSNNNRSTQAFITSNHLQLNHYYTRSKSEFAKKVLRGSNTGVDRKSHSNRTSEIANAISSDTIIDRSAIEFLSITGRNIKKSV